VCVTILNDSNPSEFTADWDDLAIAIQETIGNLSVWKAKSKTYLADAILHGLYSPPSKSPHRNRVQVALHLGHETNGDIWTAIIGPRTVPQVDLTRDNAAIARLICSEIRYLLSPSLLFADEKIRLLHEQLPEPRAVPALQRFVEKMEAANDRLLTTIGRQRIGEQQPGEWSVAPWRRRGQDFHFGADFFPEG
jgi:hypothetical protein